MALRRDNFDAFCSLLAGLVDGLAAFLGVMAAVWIRFDSGLIPLKHAELFPPRIMYVAAAAVIAFAFVATMIIGKLIDLTIGLRVSESDEQVGLDQSQHAESGYNLADHS